MSDSFEISGTYPVFVDMEIDKPDNWEEMSEEQKRLHISGQISKESKNMGDNFVGFDPSRDVVDEILEMAEVMFDE